MVRKPSSWLWKAVDAAGEGWRAEGEEAPTHAHVGGDAANIEVGHILLLNKVL
jgi:hypothetical protein